MLEEPNSTARMVAALALIAVIVASGSFLGLVYEVRRQTR